MGHLPKTWDSIALDHLAIHVLGGDWGKNADYADPDYVCVRCIRASELRDWEIEHGSSAALRKIKKSSLASRELQDGDIVVEVSGGGPEQPVGRTALINSTVLAKNPEHPKICTNFFRLLRPARAMNSSFLNFYLKFIYKTGEITAYQAGSNNLRNLKFNDYLTIRVPIPPATEQRRIVVKIEELFSELDKGIESLKAARAKLNIYRQAVLKHAFEGKLTAQWREENKDKLETPEQSLARIKQEREARYEQQLQEWKISSAIWCRDGQQGQKPKKPLKPKLLPPLTAENLTRLPSLPSGWRWVRIGEIGLVGTGATPPRSKPEYYVNGDIAWVTSGALNDPFVSRPTEFVIEAALNDTNLRIYPPHTLVVALYGEGKTRGKCSELLIEATTNQAIAAIVQEGIAEGLRGLLKWFLTKNYEEVRMDSSGGVQPNLNLGIIENNPVPICSIAEAKEIEKQIKRTFSQADELEKELVTRLQQSEILRQSILKKAFTGQLVPQDPSDEPASVLLDRIRAEKEKAVKNNHSKKTRKKKTTA